MFGLKPRDERFFDLFDKQAALIVDAARIAREFLVDLDDRHRERIIDVEHQADAVAHDAMTLLHSTFITPLERGDIRQLVVSLDDVVDFIEEGAARLVLYGIDEPFAPATALVETLGRASVAVQGAVAELRTVHKKHDLIRRAVEIKRLETEGDRCHQDALAKLFGDGADPLRVVKWKDVLDDFESAIDRCEDIAHIIEGIVIEIG